MTMNIRKIQRRYARRLHRFFFYEELNTAPLEVDLSRLQPSFQPLPDLETTLELRVTLDQHHDLALSFTWTVPKVSLLD
jgi:hypothetical protein